jgi:hypothetical protein
MGAPGGGSDRGWRFRRAAARVAPVDEVVAAYATGYHGCPVRRRDVPDGPRPTVTWSIEGEVAVELLVVDDGPDVVVVHELGLLAPLRKRLRTRHLRVELAPPADG